MHPERALILIRIHVRQRKRHGGHHLQLGASAAQSRRAGPNGLQTVPNELHFFGGEHRPSIKQEKRGSTHAIRTPRLHQ